MTVAGTSDEADHFIAHVALEKRVVDLERKQEGIDRLAKNVSLLAGQVQKLGLALGIAHHTPVPEEWEEITQVKRPELARLRVRAKRGPAAAGAGVGLIWAIVELLRAVADGRIRLPWQH
jgi:hypothetical protein